MARTRKEEILSAVVKSGRSYEEIMNFLNAGSDGEKTEKQNYFEAQIQGLSIQAEKAGSSHLLDFANYLIYYTCKKVTYELLTHEYNYWR